MKVFKADLHIHTVLSPCGDLEMSPDAILKSAFQADLDIIAITDHNSTRQVAEIMRQSKNTSIFVIGGVEINSREEVHCLAYFNNLKSLRLFQSFLDEHLPQTKNHSEIFGDQLVVNDRNEIIYSEEKMLINALDVGVAEVAVQVHGLGGLFVPAHIRRRSNGILSQLGMIPEDLSCDALEVVSLDDKEVVKNQSSAMHNVPFIASSDAHYLPQIGQRNTDLLLESCCFNELKMAFKGENGRAIVRLNNLK